MDDKEKLSILREIRSRRAYLNLTIVDVAKELNISKSAYSKKENTIERIKLVEFIQICEFLGLSFKFEKGKMKLFTEGKEPK